jgi:hypothetical protein
MIAAIGEGKALGGTAPDDGRVGRPYINEVVLLRANPGASQAQPPFGWPIGPTLAGTTGAGSSGCRPASNMQATIASWAMRTMASSDRQLILGPNCQDHLTFDLHSASPVPSCAHMDLLKRHCLLCRVRLRTSRN